MVLGQFTEESTQYGRQECTVAPIAGADLSEQLRDAMANIHAEITEYEREDDELSESTTESIPADPDVRNFSFTLVDGQIYYRENSRMNKMEVSITAANRIKGMIELRDCTRRLIEYQLEGYLCFSCKCLSAKFIALVRRAFAPKRAIESQIVDRAHLDYDTIYDRILQINPSLVSLIHTVKAITPPQWGEANTIVKRVRNGETSARIRLFEMYMRIVLKNALWMHDAYEVPIDDAIQESGIGLLLAIDKFDASDEQAKFSVYAPWWMRQNMMRELPVRERIVRLPIHFREKIIKITPIIDNHVCDECGSNPPCHNLIEIIQSELACDYASAIFIWSFTQYPLSLEILRQDEKASEQFDDHGTLITRIEDKIDSARLAAVVDNVLSGLKPREREILEMRHGLAGTPPMTLEEIGAKFDLTRERIRQIESKAIKKLRHPSRTNVLRPFLSPWMDSTRLIQPN